MRRTWWTGPPGVTVNQTPTRTSRAERLRMPLARDVVRDLAAENGGCVRPVQLRRTDTQTGQVDQVLIPCGHTLASVCPSCAQRAKALRAAQCREGWHLDHEPTIEPGQPDETQRWWVEKRADVQAERDHAEHHRQDTADLARITSVTPQNMSLTVSKLAEGGYLVRKPHATNARVNRLVLTPRGLKVLRKAAGTIGWAQQGTQRASHANGARRARGRTDCPASGEVRYFNVFCTPNGHLGALRTL